MRSFVLKLALLLAVVLSTNGCFKFKTLGNATGYGGGHPILAILKAKAEILKRAAERIRDGEDRNILFVLQNNSCPAWLRNNYCADLLNLSEDQRAYLRSHFIASADRLVQFLPATRSCSFSSSTLR
ncbi:MAG: hypothetical protein R3B54_13645 [Bdellovibrionota bacterium]